MSSTFFDRIDHLIDQVGDGNLVGTVKVDQVYAHYQEVGEEFEHPRGGQAHYLRDSLYEDLDGHMATLARGLITPEGSDIRNAMGDVTDRIGDGVHRRAPREYGDLETSDHEQVHDEGALIYDNPPLTPRLSEGELRLKHAGLHHRGRRRGRARNQLGRK